MPIPEKLPAYASNKTSPPNKKRRGRLSAILLCLGVLLWYGSALYQRLTYNWFISHNISGFVSYGYHEIEFSKDGSLVAIAHGDQSKILDWAKGVKVSELEQYGGQGIADFSSDSRIVSRFPDRSKSGEAYLWNALDGKLLGQLRLPAQVKLDSSAPFFSHDNKTIIAVCDDGLIAWDLSDLNRISHIEFNHDNESFAQTILSWNPVTREMTAVDANGKLLKIDLQKETVVPLLSKQEKAVKSAQWSPDGTRLLTVDREDETVSVWNIPTESLVAKILEKDILYACFSPNGEKVLTAAKSSPSSSPWNRRTCVWNAGTGELIQQLSTTACVTLSPDWSFWIDAGFRGVRIAKFDGSDSSEYPGLFDGHGSIRRFAKDNHHVAYVNGSGHLIVMQHRDASHPWLVLKTFDLWMTILAIAGLIWCLRKRTISGQFRG